MLSIFRKSVIVWLIASGSVLSAYSQNTLSISGIYANGKLLLEDEALYHNDTIAFSIQDELGNKIEPSSCVWKFQCLDTTSLFIVDKEINNNEFILILDSLHARADLLKKIRFEGDSSVYFQARILCSGQTVFGEMFDLYFPVLLNLLPSVPTVKIIDSKYVADTTYSIVTVSILSDRADGYIFIQKQYDGHDVYLLSQNVSDPNNFSFWSMVDVDKTEFIIKVSNNFGYTLSKSYLLSDIITSIENVIDDNPISFYPNPCNDILYFKGNSNDVKNLTIYDIHGKLIKEINSKNLQFIDVSDLPKGVFLICVKCKSKIYYYKLIKK